jgi:hypothetical protein
MSIRRGHITLLLSALLALEISCSSDPVGPVGSTFVDDGTYGVRGGETHRVVIPVRATTVSVPSGVGGTGLLTLGRLRGIDYRAVLIRFDISVSTEDAGKTVSEASFHFPMEVESPENTAIPVTIHQLLSSFDDADSITAVPPYDPVPIADSLGDTVDTLTLQRTEYSVDTAVVNAWMSGQHPNNGIAIVWAAVPDSATTLEMNAREYGSNPPSLRVYFTDGTSATYASIADYTITTFTGSGLNVVGGVSTRIFFTFDPSAVPERAILNASFLVLTTRGDQGLGATAGEQLLLGFATLFYYYMYAPGSSDTLSSAWLAGTGVDRSSFEPQESDTVKMNLRGYVADILKGARANTGLVLQTDKELRVQRAAFASSGGGAPYIEIVYSMPASFGGAR